MFVHGVHGVPCMALLDTCCTMSTSSHNYFDVHSTEAFVTQMLRVQTESERLTVSCLIGQCGSKMALHFTITLLCAAP